MYPYINIFGLMLPSYGICMTVGFFLTALLVVKKAAKNNIIFEDVVIVAASVLIGTIIGGGLLYIFTTFSLSQIWEFITHGEFSFLFSGLVFYGGLVGGIVGGIVSAKLLKLNIGVLAKCIVPFIPFGHAIGRIGCLLAGCCYGFRYDGIFSVRLIDSVTGEVGNFFPVQIVEAVLDIVIMFILLKLSSKGRQGYTLLSIYLVLYAVMRFGLEFLRGDAIRGSYLFLSTSQWISVAIILVILVVFAVKFIRYRRT